MLAEFGRHRTRKAAMDEIAKIATKLGPNNDAVEAVEAIIGSELIPKSEGGRGVHQFVIEYGEECAAEGKAEVLVDLVKDGLLAPETAADRLGMSVEEFAALVQ